MTYFSGCPHYNSIKEYQRKADIDMQTIYIDVLIILNIYVNFFLLKITSSFTHSPLKTSRCILSSVYGSIYSLLILIPHLSNLLVTLIKLSAAVTIVMAAFGISGKKRLFINTAAFFSANFVLAGAVYAVYSWFSPEFIHMENSYFYIDFSITILLVTTAAIYFAISLIRRFSLRFTADTGNYRVSIRYRNRSVQLSGLADTGNALTDLFTGTPVVVCDPDSFPELSVIPEKLPKGFRLLPCGTVSGSGVMPVFRPDEVVITNNVGGEKKIVNVMIGLGKSSGKAIFNPDILKN